MLATLQVLNEAIFDLVVVAAWHSRRDFGPLGWVQSVQENDEQIFLEAPLLLDDARVQVVTVPLSALLSDASRETLRDFVPVLGTLPFDDFDEKEVFLSGPGLLARELFVLEL